ncbi:hypothetical protein [Streptomyces viridosporus]|uniref:hypothetical protein n=1 Tax=Streptomyces viridosporus TaxID=67581 RepID=UPI00332735B8
MSLSEPSWVSCASSALRVSCEALTVAVGGAVSVWVPPVVEQALREQPTAAAATARTVLRERVRGAAVSARNGEAPPVSRAPRHDGFLPADGRAEAGSACGAVPGVPLAGA